MTYHHNTFKKKRWFSFLHTTNETKFNAKGPTTSHRVPLSLLCYYTIVFKIRYLIGHLGDGGKVQGVLRTGFTSVANMANVESCDWRNRQNKSREIFLPWSHCRCGGVTLSRSSERILSLVDMWYKATNFRGIVGDCRSAAPTDFIGGISVALSRLTERIQSLVVLWYKANFRGIVGDCRLAAPTDLSEAFQPSNWTPFDSISIP